MGHPPDVTASLREKLGSPEAVLATAAPPDRHDPKSRDELEREARQMGYL